MRARQSIQPTEASKHSKALEETGRKTAVMKIGLVLAPVEVVSCPPEPKTRQQVTQTETRGVTIEQNTFLQNGESVYTGGREAILAQG